MTSFEQEKQVLEYKDSYLLYQVINHLGNLINCGVFVCFHIYALNVVISLQFYWSHFNMHALRLS